MQDSVTAQCSGEMGHRIRAEHERNPVVSRRGDVNISLGPEVTESCIRQILTHREYTSLERCSRGLVSPPNAWVAVPFEQELGIRQTTLSDVAKGLSGSLRKSLKEPPGSLATEREN